MSRLRHEIDALDRDAAALDRLAHDRYPDGRTVPRVGDEVYTFTPGMFGGEAVLHGQVVARRGALAVRVKSGTSQLGGRQAFGRARVYPISKSWTLKGEEHPARAMMRESAGREKREEDERQRAMQEAREAAQRSGRPTLDRVGPRAGMRIELITLPGYRARVLEPRFDAWGDDKTTPRWHYRDDKGKEGYLGSDPTDWRDWAVLS